jgi:hypothetical protein
MKIRLMKSVTNKKMDLPMLSIKLQISRMKTKIPQKRNNPKNTPKNIMRSIITTSTRQPNMTLKMMEISLGTMISLILIINCF